MKPLTIGAVRKLASHCSMASGLRPEADGGARDEAQHDHHDAHDDHDAAGALGADERRPIQELGLVQQAEQLGSPDETTAWVDMLARDGHTAPWSSATARAGPNFTRATVAIGPNVVHLDEQTNLMRIALAGLHQPVPHPQA